MDAQSIWYNSAVEESIVKESSVFRRRSVETGDNRVLVSTAGLADSAATGSPRPIWLPLPCPIKLGERSDEINYDQTASTDEQTVQLVQDIDGRHPAITDSMAIRTSIVTVKHVTTLLVTDKSAKRTKKAKVEKVDRMSSKQYASYLFLPFHQNLIYYTCGFTVQTCHIKSCYEVAVVGYSQESARYTDRYVI